MDFMDILHRYSFDGNARLSIMSSTTSDCFWIALELRSTLLPGLFPNIDGQHTTAVD